ncbi:putative ribonuclease H-like domain-containing protein [Tanacetum coccineum]
MNKLVRGNLVRGLPLKIFENDHSCVACQKGKQHKASYKAKLVNLISKPLHMLHMDLFGPTNVKSLMKKSYCLVVTDDFSRFFLVFFLATKDETSRILKTFITGIENQLDYKVKVIRYDNGTEFKNSVMNQFCEMKGIKREFSVARTLQQNGVAERKNKTLIEAARTMLVDSKLPTTFWAEAVNTACNVLNRVLVIKPHNKTPYELIHGRPLLIDLMKPFRCPVTILNTRDHLGKFDKKADEGYFVGYSVISKAIRVFNKRTMIVEETLNIRFLENAPNVKGNEPDWLFDVDSLSKSMNYVPVVVGNQTNGIVGTKDNIVAGQAQKEKEPEQEYILIPFCTTNPLISQSPKDGEEDDGMKPIEVNESGASDIGEEDDQDTRSNTPVSIAGPSLDNTAGPSLHNTAENIDMVKNKARLVAQRYTQEEGIDYDEVFAPVAMIKAIRLFLAYASFNGFVVYQMDVKSAFLYGKIEEEAPRAWYETLSTYLLDNGFHRGQIDKTLFIKRHKDDILLVQVYVDDIIFGSTKKELSTEFENLMHDKFELYGRTYFLGLQVQQKSDGIFISQDKYVAEILKKFDFATVKTASTPIETNKALVKDEEAEAVDVHLYRSMIGSLMYLTASRLDIMFVVYACARFQVTPKTSHLHAVKRIFRYLKGQSKLCLWYPRDSPFDLEAFSNSDYAGASLDRKSTIGGCQFLSKILISWQCKKQTIVAYSTTEEEYVAAANCCGQAKHIEYLVGDEAVHKELGDRMERAATTASSLEAEQDSGSGPRVHTLGSGEDNMKLMELMARCTKLSALRTATTSTSANGEVELTATIDGQEKTITEASLRRHLKLEDHGGIPALPNSEIFEHLALMGVSRGYSGVDIPLFPTMITAPETSHFRITSSPSLSPQHTPVSTPSTSQPPNTQPTPVTEEPAPMPHESPLKSVHLLGRDEGSLSLNELTDLCTSLSKKVEEDEIAPEDSSKQGRKIFDIDEDPNISLRKNNLLELVEDIRSGEKGASEVSIANIAVTTAEVSTAAENLVYIRRSAEKKKGVLCDTRFHAQQNRSFFVVEVRKNMCTYLKNQGGYKMSYFKGMTYEEIRPIFEKVWDQNHTFIPMDSEIEKEVMKRSGFDLQESSKKVGGSRKKTLARKRAGGKDSEESVKRQKIEDDTEEEELKAYLDIVPGDDIAVEVESLATKYPIVDWKTHVLTENFMYYQIIRADGSFKNYKIFSDMLDDFDRHDVIDLHRLVEERYRTTSPGGYDLLLWGDLKTLFEPNKEHEIWKNQQNYNLISWRLFDSCGVHVLLMDNGIAIHMMTEKKFPLVQEMLLRMLSRRLEVDHESEMTFELLRFTRSQLHK